MPFRPNLPGPGPLFRIPIGEAEAAAVDATVVLGASVDAVAALPSPTLASNQVVTPTTVVAVAAVPAPTILAAALVLPSTVVGVAAVPAPTILAAVIKMPDLVMAPHRAA